MEGGRSAYYPFVGRRAPRPGSSQGSDIVMEDRTGREAKELGDALEIPGVDGLVAQLSKAARRRPLWPVGLLTTAAAVGVLAARGSSGASPTASAFVLVLGLAATVCLALRDLARRSVVMRYESEDATVQWPDSPISGGPQRGLRASMRRALHARMWRSGDAPSKRVAASEAQSFQELTDAWRELARRSGLWRVERSGCLGSSGRGARSGIEICDLKDATRGLEGPGALVTNIEVLSVVAGDHALHLLPDRLLVCEGKRFAELSYRALQVDWQAMRFAESEEDAPADGERVGKSWEKINRDGRPDKRYKNNSVWPEMRYGRLELTSETGLRWILLSSQAGAAERVFEAVRSWEKPGSVVSVRAAGEQRRVRRDSTAA